ncbi:MAG: GAF domain-containing protein [Chthoniobacter sp.]
MRALVVDCFQAIGAHEGTVWLLDESRNYLIPRFNTGAERGEFRRPLPPECARGDDQHDRVHRVAAVRKRRQQKPAAGQIAGPEAGLQTCAMLATPLYFAGELRGRHLGGAIALARTRPRPEPPGFSPQHLATLQLTATIFSRLIEQQLLTLAIGLDDQT